MEQSLNLKPRLSAATDSKYWNLFFHIDREISKNVFYAGITTRSAKSSGFWCCLLLPTILCLYNCQHKVPLIYTLSAYVSIGLLAHSFLLTYFLYLTSDVLKHPKCVACVPCGLVSTLLVYTVMGQDLLVSLILTIPATLLQYHILRYILYKFPKTFSVGEAFVVTQGLVLFGVMSVGKILLNHAAASEDKDLVNTVLYVVFVALIAIVGVLTYLPDQYRNPYNLLQILVVVAICLLCTLHILIGRQFLIIFLNYIFLLPHRLQILTFWLFLVLLSVLIINRRIESGERANTSTRKSFHILASLVFLPGILFDQEFMKLAAGVAFGLIIFVEALRKLSIKPFSSVLQTAFDVYSDEKDAGSFAMTPIYLFVGLACPLILVPRYHGNELEMLSGVLSVGVGDTAASYIGSNFGRHKWRGSDKTIEGTVANIASQVALIFSLRLFGFFNYIALVRVCLAATVSSLVEAKTEQVDNLILPLITIIAFQITWFL